MDGDKSMKPGTLVTFKEVGFSFPPKKKGGERIEILKDVSGYFAPGSLTALMGPSGAGKTTFLDIVTGRKTTGSVSGSLLYDGARVSKSFLKQHTAYVEQFDTLLPVLTVKQMLMYQCELKCSRSESHELKRERVDKIIIQLGLSKCADVMVGDALHPGISGGQAKRTNIGIALVTEPRIIFLDEPTSGLDSATSLDVVTILRKLADSGRTIMSTIHSPTSEAFRLFHNLLLLVKGNTVYFGPLQGERGAASYMATLGLTYDPTTNLADFLIEKTGDDNAAQVVDTELLKGSGVFASDADGMPQVDFAKSWATSEYWKDASAELTKMIEGAKPFVEQPGFVAHNSITAVGVLLRYRTAANYKFPDFVAPRIAPMVLFGLIISSLYLGVGDDAADPYDVAARNNVASALFMSVALPSFTAAGYMPSIVAERPLFYRETADGCYSAFTYIIYKLMEEGIPQILGTFIFTALTTQLIAFPGNFLWHWLILFMTGQIGIALAYTSGAVARNMDEANTLLPIYNVTGMFFTGLLFTYETIPSGWRWYTWTCFVRYAWSAHMVNNFGSECDVPAGSAIIDTPGCPIEYWGIDVGSAGTSVGANFLAMLGFWVFWVCTAWCVMANVRHTKR